jgi:lipoate---protein ligase
MYLIISPIYDPFFNLAAEEYFFKNFAGDLLFLYRNDPSVVVGKHQNTIAEINSSYIDENKIKVVRRMSGGGAVFHDRGNLNFSFQKTVGDLTIFDSKLFIVPIVEVLNSLGISAGINLRNDIVVNGIKVSGHAQHIFRNRVMSHGTLLINSDLEMLSGSLKRSSGTYESKAIQSVRSEVGNVSDYADHSITVEEILNALQSHLSEFYPGIEKITIPSSDIFAIENLAKEKYSTWEWNFGISPNYRFKNEIELVPGQKLSCNMLVEKGIITEANLTGKSFPLIELKRMGEKLTGQRHSFSSLQNLIHSDERMRLVENQLIRLLF